MSTTKAHISPAKKQAVKDFAPLLKEFPIIGVANMANLPSAQLLKIRGSLRTNGVVIKMTKKRVLKIILQEAEKHKPGITKLVNKLDGMPALLFAKDNPFKLYKTIQARKSSAPAKAGSIAPRDIIVPAGPTPFAPGPIISELAQLKIKAGIVDGKVAIKEDATVARKGDTISAQLSSILLRLNILPMEIGLDLVSVWENGFVFDASLLAVDEKQFIANIQQAHTEAFNLAIECAVFNSDTTGVLLGKAFTEAKAVALEAAILSPETVDEILATADRQASSVESLINK